MKRAASRWRRAAMSVVAAVPTPDAFLGTALLFLRRRKRDLNARAAFLHMAADAAVSAGVVVAGLAMRVTGLPWIDPVVGLAVVVAIGAGSWGVLRESMDLALDAVPRGIDRDAVEAYLAGLPGITAVHDLHIWTVKADGTEAPVYLTDGRYPEWSPVLGNQPPVAVAGGPYGAELGQAVTLDGTGSWDMFSYSRKAILGAGPGFRP